MLKNEIKLKMQTEIIFLIFTQSWLVPVILLLIKTFQNKQRCHNYSRKYLGQYWEIKKAAITFFIYFCIFILYKLNFYSMAE